MSGPGRLQQPPPRVIKRGKVLDFNVLAAPTVQHVLRLQQPPPWVIKRGKVLATNALERERIGGG